MSSTDLERQMNEQRPDMKLVCLLVWTVLTYGATLTSDEHLSAGAENLWTTWKALNRLRTQVGLSRVNMLERDFPTKQKHVTVASGRPCNIYRSAPWRTLPALLKTWQRLMASPSAVATQLAKYMGPIWVADVSKWAGHVGPTWAAQITPTVYV